MIVVTAPTSQIGRRLVGRLLADDAPVRVVARDPARLPTDVRERVDVVTGSHADLDVVTRAFDGADAVFWLVPPNPTATDVEAAYLDFSRPAVKAFEQQEVGRVVGVSALGRGTAVADHAGQVTATLALDDLIASSGVGYRALTMPSFMDNIARQAELIKNQGFFTSPFPADRALPMCATQDIATVAARLLQDASWSGVSEVPVLGPEDLSFGDLARIMSEVLDRPIRYQQIPGTAFKDRLLQFGATEVMAQATLDMYLAKEAGLDDGAVRTPQNRTPTTFRQWCEETLRPAVVG